MRGDCSAPRHGAPHGQGATMPGRRGVGNHGGLIVSLYHVTKSAGVTPRRSRSRACDGHVDKIVTLPANGIETRLPVASRLRVKNSEDTKST